MKHYYCKECEKRTKVFKGTRNQVRKHIREDHRIKHELTKWLGSIEDA